MNAIGYRSERRVGRRHQSIVHFPEVLKPIVFESRPNLAMLFRMHRIHHSAAMLQEIRLKKTSSLQGRTREWRERHHTSFTVDMNRDSTASSPGHRMMLSSGNRCTQKSREKVRNLRAKSNFEMNGYAPRKLLRISVQVEEQANRMLPATVKRPRPR